MDFLTLETCKTLLGISGTDKDDQITLLLDIVEADIKVICNNTFADGYPAAMQIYAAKMVGVHLNGSAGVVASESIGNYSVSYSNGGQYPTDVVAGLKRYTNLSFARGSIILERDEKRGKLW